MKIAILEWICGGGMLRTAFSEIPASLLCEGAAMLEALVRTFALAGETPSIALDGRIPTRQWSGCEVQLIDGTASMLADTVPMAWIELAQNCDCVILIAPEFDGILQTCLHEMRAAGIPLFNCSGAFLDNACDKLRTARCLEAAGIPHPPTVAAEGIDEAWLREKSVLATGGGGAGEPQWILKPRDGAGSERLELCRTVDLPHAASNLIVQPCLPGQPYSCSALVDQAGNAHWLPLATQELNSQFQYRGGRIEGDAMCLRPPLQLLDRVLRVMGPGALGWVSLDLLYAPEAQAWTVIEVNPRCTTSLIGLAQSQAVPGGLGRAFLEANGGELTGLRDSWRAVSFSADGTTRWL